MTLLVGHCAHPFRLDVALEHRIPFPLGFLTLQFGIGTGIFGRAAPPRPIRLDRLRDLIDGTFVVA
ncbi:hypothetical protein JL101_036060 (plasmid) [Skermanella rosea]|uniref:hypothetical protein n=1 Tax=Skermanella rosea TaxID=1817965 RepID=UPI0019326EE9|nr:hypothetical protein [Skermanella rosea]UEM08175.1 hypothetical protein JL101_036060 [Skermanella rosea]